MQDLISMPDQSKRDPLDIQSLACRANFIFLIACDIHRFSMAV